MSNQNRGYSTGLAVLVARIYTTSYGALWERPLKGGPWRQVPTSGLAASVVPAGLKRFGQSKARGLTIAPGYQHSMFMSVPTILPKYGAPPPIIEAGAYTRDGGTHWTMVQPPAGIAPEDFGGLQTAGRAVWAWWQEHQTIVTTATNNGGASWLVLAP